MNESRKKSFHFCSENIGVLCWLKVAQKSNLCRYVNTALW